MEPKARIATDGPAVADRCRVGGRVGFGKHRSRLSRAEQAEEAG